MRKLSLEEHGKTRALWESVFPEDTKEFLDYYYFIKSRDNTIYVIETDGAIRSMLQLNPYLLQIGCAQKPCHYVIAVSTEEAYRGRGYCRELLLGAMADLYAEKEPFVYLMPAAEAIYTPYGFRFIYRQSQAKVKGCFSPVEGDTICCRDARVTDAGQMAELFEQWLASLPEEKRPQIYARRDVAYYQRGILEQQSENGGYFLLLDGGELKGMFAYSNEGELELLEPVFLPDYEEAFYDAIGRLTGESTQEIPCFALACTEEQHVEKKPLIMARLLHLETLFRCLQVEEGEELDISFAVIDSILTQNSRIWRLRGSGESESLEVLETEDSQGVITVEALTEFLFGQKTVEELEKEEYVILTEELKLGLNKLKLLEPVFLNELV